MLYGCRAAAWRLTPFYPDGLMYWSDFGSGDIRRANLDGTGQQTLLTGLPGPTAISLDLTAPIPEPSTLLVLGIGTVALIGWKCRRKLGSLRRDLPVLLNHHVQRHHITPNDLRQGVPGFDHQLQIGV